MAGNPGRDSAETSGTGRSAEDTVHALLERSNRLGSDPRNGMTARIAARCDGPRPRTPAEITRCILDSLAPGRYL